MKFPALQLAYAALRSGGDATITLNAANEIAVAAFLQKRIGFLAIAQTVAETLASVATSAVSCIDDVFAADSRAREATIKLLDKKYGNAA